MGTSGIWWKARDWGVEGDYTGFYICVWWRSHLQPLDISKEECRGRFQTHQFRHTVGTRMINLSVPVHIIQRYLGHDSPEMTTPNLVEEGLLDLGLHHGDNDQPGENILSIQDNIGETFGNVL